MNGFIGIARAPAAADLHSPGPIGDVTPGTGAFSGALAVGSQVVIGGTWGCYDFRVQLPSNGEISFTAGVLNFQLTPDVKLVRASAATLEVTGTGSTGIVLSSPNGTRYRIAVANDGTISTTAV